MKTRLEHIILVLGFITFSYIANAQSLSLTPFEGGIYSYSWDGIAENDSYTFSVVALNGEQTGEYEFIGTNSGIVGNDGLASVQIRWNSDSAFNQYQVWLEVSSGGCSNQIFIGVTPQLNNRSIGFDVVASNECFSPGGNGFELPVSFLGNEGEPLTQNQFPVSVEFSVNGTVYQQIMQSAADNLQIENTMVAANPAQDTQVVVEITGAIDAHSAEIFPGEDKSMHTRTIFAIPEIEFTQRLKLQKKWNEEITAHTVYSPVSFDWQEPGPGYTGGE